jgi:hypothetical protein
MCQKRPSMSLSLESYGSFHITTYHIFIIMIYIIIIIIIMRLIIFLLYLFFICYNDVPIFICLQFLVRVAPKAAQQQDFNSHFPLHILSRTTSALPHAAAAESSAAAGLELSGGMRSAQVLLRAQELVDAASLIGKGVECMGASLVDIAYNKRNRFEEGEIVAVKLPVCMCVCVCVCVCVCTDVHTTYELHSAHNIRDI